MEKKSRKQYLLDILKLFGIFFKIGLFSFGGGYAMLSLIEAELVKNDAGNFDTYIYVSSQLSDETVNLINAANGQYFPILTKRGMDTLAYQITGFKYVQRTSKGYSYEIKGKLCKDALCTDLRNPAFGDSLAFNHPANDVDPVNSIFASVM